YITTDPITPDMIRQGIPPVWSDKVRISTEQPWPTEPASNPFVEAYGDSVFATWRGPNEQGDSTKGDIWRRARWIHRPPDVWYTPRNMSETQHNESNYPVMSTNFVTVWQEQIDSTNWDIWARFEPEPAAQPIFETPNSSQFPHIAGYWDPFVAVFHCNTVWTEQIDTNLYEVKFGRYDYSPQSQPPYYVVEVGDTNPSPYCLKRDGYLQYGSYSVDYDTQGLKYQLSYLNPQYSYLLRAIIYRTGRNNWIEEFYTDSTLTATALFEPNKPETVWFQLPKESYENTEVLQEIERIVGSHALIADLRLYQTEVFEDSGGGAQSAGSFAFQRAKLYQSFPNPFKFRANIRFQLPVQSEALLTIYDITGRAVRRLLDEVKEPGEHTVVWDGKDDRGKTLAQGIYFYRLKANRFSETKRLVLIR
ncbi:MAG: FlgD immunoglobulin-like domain containing protein, partial [candidate division WOR-3 bacterium]